jgi:thiol-disulfide isomerase/thioredoxin
VKTFSIIIAVLILTVMLILPASAIRTESPVVGEYFPPFVMSDTNGEMFDLAGHYNTGKYILVDFWAYWCGPCKYEMPNVVDAWKQFGGDNFLVVAFNLDSPDTEAEMYAFIEENEMTFPVVTELGGWETPYARELNIRYIPQNYLLAPDGTIVMRDLRGDDVVKAIEGLMSLPRLYEPITMDIEVQDDPRDDENFKWYSLDWEQIYHPFGRPLNITPDDLKLRIHVNNHQTDRYQAVLYYEMYRPTGRKTHRVKDIATGEVMRRNSGEPYIYYEVEVEEVEITLDAWDNELDTGYVISLGEDVWEVRWGLRVHSDWIDFDLVGARDSIDFTGFRKMSCEMIENQGGIYFAKD